MNAAATYFGSDRSGTFVRHSRPVSPMNDPSRPKTSEDCGNATIRHGSFEWGGCGDPCWAAPCCGRGPGCCATADWTTAAVASAKHADVITAPRQEDVRRIEAVTGFESEKRDWCEACVTNIRRV